jgi:hypothetical protein
MIYGSTNLRIDESLNAVRLAASGARQSREAEADGRVGEQKALRRSP